MNDSILLQQGISYLKRKALAGSDPNLYVDIVVDNRDEMLYAKLIHKILNDDFSTFAALDADISKPAYEPFFRSIYDGIRSIFTQSHPVADDSSGAGGNGGDASDDERSSKKGRKKS